MHAPPAATLCALHNNNHPPMLASLLAFLVAATLGAMLFFAGAVAPTVFRALPPEHAARFLRTLFPVYYVVLLAASTLALALALAGAGGSTEAALLVFTALGFAFARWVLVPGINAARDAQNAGDAAAARRFAGLHRLSVALNLLQMLALAWVLVLLAGAGLV